MGQLWPYRDTKLFSIFSSTSELLVHLNYYSEQIYTLIIKPHQVVCFSPWKVLFLFIGLIRWSCFLHFWDTQSWVKCRNTSVPFFRQPHLQIWRSKKDRSWGRRSYHNIPIESVCPSFMILEGLQLYFIFHHSLHSSFSVRYQWYQIIMSMTPDIMNIHIHIKMAQTLLKYQTEISKIPTCRNWELL